MSPANSKSNNHSAASNANSGDAHVRGTLTRQDIALAIYERCEGLSRREAKRLVDSVIEEFVSTLARGETLKLHDFGSFVVRAKSQRAGRNPRTGETVPIQSRRVVVFKASPNMKATVNGESAEKDGAAPQRRPFAVTAANEAAAGWEERA
jgi:integration host factor subunit alpha